jgi:hypothetical protein
MKSDRQDCRIASTCSGLACCAADGFIATGDDNNARAASPQATGRRSAVINPALPSEGNAGLITDDDPNLMDIVASPLPPSHRIRDRSALVIGARSVDQQLI